MTFGVPGAPASVFAQEGPWTWVPRPTVWLLIVGLSLLYWYAVTRIGPRATIPGEAVVTRSQLAWFVATMAVLWAASDWPLHDIGENYLYSAHMVQHLLLSFVLPPMAWLATPTWLARLVVGSGLAYRIVRYLARPLMATLIFNAVVVLQHWPVVVNTSVGNGPFHYGVHVLVVFSSLLMWLPVAGPLPELRPPLAVQMIHLFAQSIIPTVPTGFLVFAEGTVYRAYDVPYRLWGLSTTDDQQLAGAFMKVLGGMYLWMIIGVLFVRFVTRHVDNDRASGAALDRRAPRQPQPASTASMSSAPIDSTTNP
jgi:putative membrane protein